MPRAGLDPEVIVGAAADIADAEGLEALTLARLAGSLGVRTPSLYAHIGGVDDLRARLGIRGAGELLAALRAAATGQSRADALRAVAAAYRAYAHAHPGAYAAMQRARGDGTDDDAVRELVDVVAAVLAGYGLAGEEVIHAVRAVRSALHGFVSLEREGGFGMPLELDDSFDRLVAMLDRGLLLASRE